MKASSIQNNFVGGEWSPLAHARVDSDRYKTALALCENYVPTVQGPLIRRPGTKFVAPAKYDNKKARLVRFEFSATQAYILEFGDSYLRFYMNEGQILSGGVPYEIATPYLEADLPGLKFTQSADVLYVVHPSYAPRKITRTGHTAWTIATISLLDGPYLPINSTTTTIATGNIAGISYSIVASSTTGINGGAGFQASDVGRLLRHSSTAGWAYYKITSVTDSTHAVADIQGVVGAGTGAATTNWRLGIYYQSNYPAVVIFHEDRLALMGAPNYPQRIDFSNSGDYENFAPSDAAATVVASNAIALTINSNDVNNILWAVSDEKGLLVGTKRGEWVIKPSATGEALSPTNINAKRATSYGSENMAALQLGKSALFLQRTGRKIRELSYFFDVEGFRATDLTALAEHNLLTGVVDMAQMEVPQSLLFAARGDGKIAAMTYERDSDNLKAGWSRHFLGGFGDVAANAPYVESIAAIPSGDGSFTEVWMLVRRLVNGTSKRYVEYLTKFFDDTLDQSHGYFVDCGLSYDSPVSITDATIANPFVVTAPSHGFSNGDQVRFDSIVGLAWVGDSSVPAGTNFLNGKVFQVSNATTNTFRLKDPVTGAAISIPIGYSAYLSGGQVRKMVSTISGLSHLEGEFVDVMADGADYGQLVVSSGTITLPAPAAVVHVGYSYRSRAQLLRFEAGSADGTALGKKKRIHLLNFFFYRTLGIKYGRIFDKLYNLTFRKTGDQTNTPPPLFTGIFKQRAEFDYDADNMICIQQDRPYPGTIQAVMPQLMTQDDG